MVSYKRLMEIYEEEMSGVFTIGDTSTESTSAEEPPKSKAKPMISSTVTFFSNQEQVKEYLRSRGLLKEKGGVE